MYKEISSYLKKHIQKKLLGPKKLILNNTTFYLPPYAKDFPNTTMSELWMLDLFKNFIPLNTGTFVDVGVNVGQTLLKLRAVSKMDYLGFEPNINCVFYLNQLIHFNKFGNVEILPVGISTNNGLLTLHASGDDLDGSATLIKNFRKTEIKKEWMVPVFDVGTIGKSIGFKYISVLKIDVEGTEFEVLKSFETLIRKNTPYILIEVLPVYNFKNKDRLDKQLKLQELINNLDYGIYRIIKTKDKVMNLNKIPDIGIHSNLNECDYLLVHSKKAVKLMADNIY